MAASFALEFDFKGSSQICVVDYDTDWIDVYAMVKCFLELEDMEVKYIDEENDEVNLNSEDEYSLARQVALKNGNVLKFKVYRKLHRSESLRPKERQINPVSLRTGSRYDSVTGCALPGMGEYQRSTNTLATINISQDFLDQQKKPPDQFVNNIVQDILQGLDGSVVMDEDAEEFRVTQRKIRQGIKDKNHSSNIEWSPFCTRIPKKTPPPNEEFVNKVVEGVLSGLNDSDLRSAMEDEKNRKRAEGFIHSEVVCDNCERNINGIRYKCVHCPDFDLCSTCERLASIHDENHVFLKIYKPAMKGLGLRFDGQPIPLLDIPIYPTDEGVALWEQRKLKYAQKIAHKIAKAEMKFKRREEKRKRKEIGLGQVSPTKRERLEKTVDAGNWQQEPGQITGTDMTKDKLLSDWTKEFNALLLADVNFPSGTHLQPGTKFTKSWRVLNGGDIPFDANTSLKFLWGNIPTISDDPVPVVNLLPGQEGVLSVECEAPRYPGTYQSTWRLAHSDRQFGQRFACSIVVDRAEILEPREERPVSIEDEMLITKTEVALEASEAVASLQPDQSDSSSPNKIISYNTELLTAQDVLSFEMLKISKKGHYEEEEEENDVENEVRGVSTPNNTPCGLTPCMSPVPQLDAESLSNKMTGDGNFKERIVETRIEELEEHSTMSTVNSNSTCNEDPDMVIVDHETDDNTSTGSVDEDLLEDFYVVPLPDCFDLSKPLEDCVLSTSSAKVAEVTINDETVPLEAPLETIPDIDTLLATSHTLIQTPLIPLMAATPIQPRVEMVPDIVMATPGTFTAPEIILDVVNISEDNMKYGFVIPPDQEAVSLVEEAITEEAVAFEVEARTSYDGAAATDDNDNSVEVETPTRDETEEPQADGYRETELDAAEVYHDAEEPCITVPKEGGAEIPRGEGLTEIPRVEGLTEIPRVEGVTEIPRGTDNQEGDEEETESLGSQGLPQGHDQARELLGITAARAAQVATSVMRQAYDVANSAVVALLTPPPQSPPSSNFQGSHRSPMDTLIEMGFANRDKNAELLYHYNNDVNQCVQDLLSDDIENWHLTRH